MLVCMVDEKRSLLEAVGRGRARARSLAADEGPLRYHAGETVPLEVLERELAAAEAKMGGALLERERARLGLRAVAETGPEALRDRARRGLLRLRAAEEEAFAPLRAQLADGTYTPQAFRADVAAKPVLERDPFVDRLLGIHDPPAPEKVPDRELSPYHASPIDELWPVFDLLGPGDVFFDLGCGLGKVLFLVRWITGARAIGVEYDPALVAAAEAAGAALGLDVVIRAADAREVDYEGGTFFYFYEPFRGAVLDAVYERIRLASSRRPIRLALRWVSDAPLRATPWMREASPIGRIRLFDAGTGGG